MTRQGDATGIIVPAIELEPIIRPLRLRADGPDVPVVPPHVTALFPWVEPPVADADIDRLDEHAAAIAPFDFRLTGVAWFGEEVLWLRPEPDEPFRRLTEGLHLLWPDHPPYGGEHKEPTPHLTIGESGDVEAMREVAAIAERLLPLQCRAEELWVMEGTWEPLRWWRTSTHRLAG